MKFPHAMLLDFVQTALSAEQIGDLLTMAGFELEGIEEVEGDAVLDIKVVSNRGDGLSVFGLSREILAKDLSATPTALYEAAASRFASEAPTEALEVPSTTATIESAGCRRFACRAFEEVEAARSAPEWIQKRLRQAGVRPISLLVDLTNYVMLEVGQPLHVFDRDKLTEGRIVVRHAQPGERLTTLNGVEHELAGQMMICDAARPVGVPGVMGGLDTEVTDTTRNVLLESANFVDTVVRKTRKQLGLSTEASYRFERSVDPDGVVAAIRRFTQLLLTELPGLKLSNVVDHYPVRPERDPIQLRPARAVHLLGMPVTPDECETYLRRLGLDVTVDGDSLKVVPPTWRPDIVREEDLVEEIGRVHGYERIPEIPPVGTTTQGGLKGKELLRERMREAALRSGFIELVSHSLRSEHPLDGTEGERIGPREPGSPEHAFLRNSLLPSLSDAALRNGGRNLHLFEVGRVFRRCNETYQENTFLGLISTGDMLRVDRKGVAVPAADFYTLKATLDQILGSAGLTADYTQSEDPRLHPTRQAQLMVVASTESSVTEGGLDITTSRSKGIGFLGQIHPDVAETLKLPASTFLAELNLDLALALANPEPALKTISRNPAVRRDITVAVDRTVPYAMLAAAIQAECGDVLERLWLADVYTGTGVEEGQQALTFGLQFRKVGSNFTDEEANQVRDRAVAAMQALGATMR